MGCDIHMVLQNKWGNDPWKTVMRGLFPKRSYDFYYWLSNVRPPEDDSKNISIAHEGLPKDFNITDVEIDESGTQDAFTMGDHSYGWVTLEEFLKADHHNMLCVKQYQDALFHLTGYFENSICKYRLVFGYDS